MIGAFRVLILRGPPLSGVTNALVQFVSKGAVRPTLFIDGKTSRDVLQLIANGLSRELSFRIAKDDLRSWFDASCDSLDLTLVIDGTPSDAGIDELIENADAGILRLVVDMDLETFRDALFDGRAEQSPSGRSAMPFELMPLSEQDLYDALDVFYVTFGSIF